MAHKVFIFIPAFGNTITSSTFLTTHALQQAFNAKAIGGGISTLSFPDIAELRAMATTIWYDTMPDTSHLLFIDSDMGFAPDAVLDMLLLDEPLVGAIYPQRKLPLSWAGSGTGEPTTERRGNFMRVEGVGMGCTLIRRDLITKMIEKFPELIDTRISLHPAGDTLKQTGANRILRLYEKMDIADRGMVSEDLSFCIRAGQCGVKVWASIGHRFAHVGQYDYGARYLDQVEQAVAAQAQAEQLVAQQALQQAALAQAPIMVVDALPQTVGGTTVAEPISIMAAMPAEAAVVAIPQEAKVVRLKTKRRAAPPPPAKRIGRNGKRAHA